MTDNEITEKRAALGRLVSKFFNAEEAANEQKLDDIPVILTQDELILISYAITMTDKTLGNVQNMMGCRLL